MTDGLLENIIDLEKQIQASLIEEQARAGRWQERELATLENSLIDTRTGIEEQRKQTLIEKKTQLLREGTDIEAAATDWCKRLEELSDSTLKEVLKRHLAGVLPGGDHDHPHGQS